MVCDVATVVDDMGSLCTTVTLEAVWVSSRFVMEEVRDQSIVWKTKQRLVYNKILYKDEHLLSVVADVVINIVSLAGPSISW